jgi:adenylate cyclase 10
MALMPYINLEQEKWASELRRLTVMFMNISIDLADAKTAEGLKRIQQVIETV